MKLKITIKDGEYWWGGSSALGERFPLEKSSCFAMDQSFTENQTMPFWLSTKGRYVYSRRPVGLTLKDGIMEFTGDGAIDYSDRDTSLREAYLSAMKKHFPFSGRSLNEAFFQAVQYNTWIEFQYHPTQQGLLDYAREILEKGFDPGILILDEGWQKRYGQWEFDPAAFPDPKAMVKELHSMGFRLMLWIVPTVSPDGEFFTRTLRQQDSVFLRLKETGAPALTKWWNGYSALLDFSRSEDICFLKRQLDFLIEQYGVDGFKFDGGNVGMYHESNILGGTLDTDLSCYELSQAYNRFAMSYPYHELKDSYGCGGLPQIQRLRDKWHRYEGEGLRSLIPDAALAGLLGHPFICPDMVGGGQYLSFLPGSVIDEELFVRWAQCSACFPMMQYSKKPWNCLSKERCNLVLEAGKLHARLTDYILSCIKKSQETGEPVLRLLEYSYPHQGYEKIVDQFLLGDDLLAAPVLSPGAGKRFVAFPPGLWKDQEGILYEGGCIREVEAPLHKLPWFWRVSCSQPPRP